MTVLLGADVAYALTGVFFVETVFNLPGIGFTGVSAIENLDYPVITAVVIVSALDRGALEHDRRPAPCRLGPTASALPGQVTMSSRLFCEVQNPRREREGVPP